MPHPVLLIVDPDPARLSALLRRCDDRAATVLGAATPGEAYVLIESHLPRRVAVAAEFAESLEFEALADILTMIDAEVMIFGQMRRAAGGYAVLSGLDQMLARLLGGAAPLPAPPVAMARGQETRPAGSTDPVGSVILLGASTGGITALETVLSGFRADCPPTLVVQHIRPGFAEGLVRRLDQLLTPQVVAAEDGAALRRGVVYLACSAERHLGLGLRGGLRTRLVSGQPVSGHRPSVDVLFQDGAALADRLDVRAGLLTGMGADGAQGMAALRRAGGHTIAQDRETSVVWGMPRVAAEIGAAAEILPLSRIGAALLSREPARSRRTS